MTRALTLACIVSLVSSLHAQSLADAARKAEETRSAATAAQTTEAKVYTRKDVEALPPEVVTATSTPPIEASAAAPADPEPIDNAGPAKDEAYWKKRVAPFLAKVDRDLRAASVVRNDLRNVEAYLLPTQASWSRYGWEWLRLTNEMSNWDATIRDDQKRIADIEEEGRVAGALPGWLR